MGTEYGRLRESMFILYTFLLQRTALGVPYQTGSYQSAHITVFLDASILDPGLSSPSPPPYTLQHLPCAGVLACVGLVWLRPFLLLPVITSCYVASKDF